MTVQEPLLVTLTSAAFGIASLAILVWGALKGWRGWLDLKRAELNGEGATTRLPAAERIEMADLRERVRKLEAIAAGVDP